MNEEISSKLTKPTQYVLFPLIVVSNVGGGIVLTIMLSWAFLLIAVMGLAMATAFARFVYRAERVIATDRGLLVGESQRLVSYREIRDVRCFKWSNPKYITVDTANGAVRFLAKIEMVNGFGEHPIAQALRDRAAKSAR